MIGSISILLHSGLRARRGLAVCKPKSKNPQVTHEGHPTNHHQSTNRTDPSPRLVPLPPLPVRLHTILGTGYA